MAATLEEEVKRKRAEDLFSDTSSDDASDSSSDASEPDRKARKDAEYVLIPEAQVDQRQAKPGLTRTYQGWGEPIPEETPQDEKPVVPPGHIDLGPPVTQDIQTDPETGARYVVDKDSGRMVPHAELATEADKQAFKPGDVTLPQVDVLGPQVPRAELVKLPTSPDESMTPGPSGLDRVQPAPDTLPRVERGELVPSRAQPEPVPPPEAPKPTPERETTFMGMPILGREAPPQKTSTIPSQPAPSDKAPLSIDTDYAVQPGSYHQGRPGDGKIQGIVLHSSDGRESGDINTLTTGGVSSHYYVTRDGRIYQFVNDQDTAYHAGKVVGNLGNGNTIGIEQEHYDPGGKGGKDGEAWSPAQVAATARLVASLKAKYGLSDDQVVGHSDVAPERKQDPYNYPWEDFRRQVNGQPGAVAVAGQPEKGFIKGRATTFGYHDPNDPGVGSPKLGKINTNEGSLVGVAIPEEALRAQVGASPAEWRKARVEIVTSDGRHMLVPIVDLGPGDVQQTKGIAADFTHGLASVLKHSDENSYQFRIVPNAGVDMMKNPQAFVAEQAQLAKGVDLSPKAKPVAAAGGYVLVPESDAQKADSARLKWHEQENQVIQAQRLDDIGQKAGNLVGLYKDLTTKPPGDINPAVLKSYTDNLQATIVKEMQKRFPDMSPEVAWAKAQENSSLWDIGGEFLHQGTAAFAQLAPVFAQASPDKEQVDAFLSQALPGVSDADKHAWLSKYYASPQEQRGQLIASHLPGAQAGQRGNDPMLVYTALEHLGDPGYQKAQADKLAAAREFAAKAGAGDPRLAGTVGGDIAATGALAEQALAYYGIPIVGAAQASEETRQKLKAENPGWSEQELDDRAAYSSLAKIYGQTVANTLVTRGAGLLFKTLTTPWKRALAQVLAGTVSNIGINTGTQALTNVAEGKPAGEGLPEAARAGAVQGFIPGLVHGAHELMAPRVGPGAVVRQPTTLPPEAIPPEVPEAITGPRGAPVRGPTERTLEEGQKVEQQPVEPPPRIQSEGPVIREEPAPEADEVALNRQAEDLYKQHQAELSLTKEEPILSDRIRDERQKERAQAVEEAISGGEAIRSEAQREPGTGGAKELEPHGDGRSDEVDIGREEAGGGENVPQELGRVPGALGAKLSVQESAAFEPEREALKTVQPGTPEFTQAFRNLRERVIQRFQPILDVLGVRRLADDYVEPSTGATHAFGAGRGGDGVLEFHSHLIEGAKDTANIMKLGGDPVENIHSSIQEEIIHFAHRQALEDEWNAKGGYKGTGNSLHLYEVRRNAGLIRDAIRARDAYRAKSDHAHANLIDHALVDSMRLYNSQRFPNEHSARAYLDSMLADPSTHGDINLHLTASELVRQLTQVGAKEPLTESHFKSWWQKAGLFYKQALRGLVNLYRKLGPRSELGKTELAKMIHMVRAKIKAVDKMVAGREITSADKQALGVEDDPKLESYRQESDQDLRDAVTQNKDPLALQVLRERAEEEQQRQAHIAEVKGEADRPSGREHLLQAIIKGGGLPHPLRMKHLAARGEKATGEMARVYDAWKALSLDVKKELFKEGIAYNKLFTKQGEGLDTFRDNLSQHPEGFNYGTTGEMLSEVERALGQAAQGRRVYGEHYVSGAPRPRKVIAPQYDFNLGKDEPFRLIGEELPKEKIKQPEPLPDTTRELLLQKPRAPGGAPVSLKQAVEEKLRGGKRWLSAVFKSGESAMLDYKETQPLALAMRRRASLEQKFGQRAQTMQLADAFNKVKAADRPRVVKEFTDYVRAEQNKQPLPPVSADTRAILDAGKNTLEQLGQISKELNVHVKTSDGKVRPMKLIGRDYYPRMISDDMRDIFNHRDDTRAAEFNNLVNRQIARGVVKSRDEFIDKFTQAVTPDPTSNGHFGNIEKAREAQLPLEFYDFSLEALIKYANRSTDRLAQIAAYGQKLSSKGKDLFDHAIEQIQRASGYSHVDKQTIINRIEQERKAEYQEREKSNLGKVSSLARSGASGAFLGNPITSAYNLIGGAGQNLTFGGPGAFFKTAAKFATIKGALENIKEARERNILKSNLRDILTDYDLVTNQGWATKGVQGFTKTMLKWGGQNLTEGINRAFAMQQAKYILNRFARIYGQDNASARSLYAMINRRGVHDLQGLAREKGQGPLTDEFLRQYVMDVHGSYGPSQSASHIFDSGAGKVLLQFQKWGANTQRMATREFIMPLVKAARDRQPADFAYHLMRNLGYIAAATGTGAASQFFSNWARDKDPRKPSIGEIYTRFAHGENWKALQYALQRAQDMIILSGFAGTLGNYSDLANQLTGANPGGRVKDPLHPPVVSLFQPFQELAQGWAGEGGKAPSPRILDQFLQSTLSAYRVGKQTLLTGANAVGLRFKPGEEMAAQNDLAFLRNRVKMFEADNPEFQAKKELKGTQSMSFAGRSQFDPYKDRIQAALLTGHPEEANLAVADWLDRFPPGEQEARRKSIQQSVQAGSPIKPGGSYKLDTELQFLSWVKQNLPPEEARKIFATAQTYAKTAMDTGILGRSKTMQRIAGIDYDKFVVVTPKVTVVAARPSQPNQPSLAEQIRKEVAAKRLMLQHR